MTNKRTIQIGDVVRDMTDAECAEIDAEFARLARDQAAKTTARQAVLDKLGLTADEVTALLS